MKTSKKGLTVVTVLMLVIALSAGCSQSKKPSSLSASPVSNYPTKPIEITVGYAAGGQTDLVTRISANGANKYLPNGQTMVVSNKTGGSGGVQLTDILVSTKPDGYKLGAANTGNLIILPNLGNVSYKANDFEPVALLNSNPNMLVVKSDAPWKTFDEWLDFVKKNPDKFTYGTAGTGDTKHVAMETVNVKYDLKTKHVGSEGSAQSIIAILGGHIMGVVVADSEVKPHIDSGKLRVLANLGSTKSELYKDTTFLKEKGFSGFDTLTGIVAPKNTPKEIINILSEAFKKSLQDPEVLAEFKKVGTPATYAGPEEFKKIIEESAATSVEVMKKAGMMK